MAGPRRWGGQDSKGRGFQPRRCRLSIFVIPRGFSPEESAVFFLCDDFFGRLFIALSLDGNLLQLLYRDRGALPAPPRHVAAAFAARLGADGDLEECGHPTRSRAARY